MALPLVSVVRDGNIDEFLDGAARGEFLLRRCRSCGTIAGPQEAQCPDCGAGDAEWMAASGGATVVSWSVVHGRMPDGTTGPQGVVAIGELDEGPWWWTQVLGAEPPDMRTGRRLAIAFEPVEGGETLPVFRVA